MTNLRLTNGTKITNTYQHLVFQTRTDALECAINEMGWEEDSIMENTHKISLETISGATHNIDITLPCMYVDSGSVDYLYFIDHK